MEALKNNNGKDQSTRSGIDENLYNIYIGADTILIHLYCKLKHIITLSNI